MTSDLSSLFTEILEGNLNSLVVHFLEVVAELFAALRAAGKKFCDVCNWGMRRPIKCFDQCRRTHVNQSVEIIVDHVIIQCANVDATRGLVSDAQHLRPI